MTPTSAESHFKSSIFNCTRMRSFRVSEVVDDLIKKECAKRHIGFSSFIRDAALDAIRERTSA